MGDPLPRILLVIFALSLIPSHIYPCSGNSGRIRVLVMGYLDLGPPIISSFRHDPLVVCSMVPSNFRIANWDLQMVKLVGGRRVRQYFPRSRVALVENYDFLIFEDAWLDPYSARQVADMRYGIEEEEIGAFVTMGNNLVTYTAWGWYGWQNSVLKELMPIKFTEEAASHPKERYAGFKIKIIKNEPPVLAMFRQFGIEKVAGIGNAWLEPKLGSTVWADMIQPFRSPTGSKAWMVSWKPGEKAGYFWIDADCLWFPWWDPYNNEYAPDVFMNILLYSRGRDLPKDIVIVHSIRRQYWLYGQYASYIQSLFAFVEKFGANTQKLSMELEEMDQGREQSFQEFRDQQYEEALGTIRLAMDQLSSLEKKAFKLKDTTLFWVYIIQWTTVTSVFLISGVVLWSLMVRRRLFREVSITRLTKDQSNDNY